MKKNRLSESRGLNSADTKLHREPEKNIPVFLVIGLCILAQTIFSSFNIAFQKNRVEASTDTINNFFWITGSAKITEGLYLLSRKQLEQNFPELLPFVSTKSAAQKSDSIISAIQYNSGLPQQITLPPTVANVFFLPISINTAGKEILSTLPGIGPVLAEKIIQRRENRGLFQSKEELLNISGIGPKKFDRLVDYIIVH
jgi:competence ComEA-like helix-hairpin-helix protein